MYARPIVPGSPGYEAARKPAMARFYDARPRAVIPCEGPDDVAEGIAYARREGLHATPRSGGHCFAGRSSTDGVVLDIAPMRSISVDDGIATVGAGARLADIYDALDAHGLTIPTGCGPGVGIAGLTLGGGLGILGRKHGLTCDSLLRAQIVLADGRVAVCDERRLDDLFWALRGAGGGHFGVVTAFAFATLPAPDATTFHLTWPNAHAAALVEAWLDWAVDAPEELTAVLRLSDRANLVGAHLGREAETMALLEQLVARAGADPDTTWHAHLPFRAAKTSLDGLGGPAEEIPSGHLFTKTELFRRPLPAEAIAALVDGLEPAPGQMRELAFTPLGGAYGRVPADATAYAHREERYLVEHILVTAPDAPRDWVTRSWSITHPWGSGRVYPNFPDPELADPGRAYHGDNFDRLRRIKAKYDPEPFFRFHQSLTA